MPEVLTEQDKKVAFDGKALLVKVPKTISKLVFKSVTSVVRADAPIAEKFLSLSIIWVSLRSPYCVTRYKNMKDSLQLFVNTPINLLKEERMS
jgi:hypothetical protein